MKTQTRDQEAIIALLTRIYFDIAAIEEQFKLIAGNGDMRPRIEYFHDAVRAFTSEEEDNRRLNIELLSYDLRCLRYIQKMPLSPFKQGPQNLSPSQTIITTEANLTAINAKPDRATRARLADLYQHYAVMFAALLKPSAEHDYQERTSIINNDIQEINNIISKFEKNADIGVIAALAQQLEEDELRIIIITFLQRQKHKSKEDVKKLLGHLKNIIKQKDNAIKKIDNAHFEFAVAQLGIFEESKDMLKKLAAQGMNLIGKFVEASIAETRRQMGR
jgi:hypothetical protein